MKRELLLALSIGMITLCVVTLGMTGLVATAYGAPVRVSPSDPGTGSEAPAVQTDGLAPGVLGVAAGTDVKNLNTGNTYATIADALADAATLAGHVIEVQVSPHAEGIVNVTKSVTIQGMTGTEIVNAAANTGSSGDARGWFVINADDVTFQGLTLDGSGFQIYQAIRCNNAGLVVDGCTIQHIQYQQYLGFGITSVGNATVTDCTMSDIERLGVLLFGSGVTSGSVANLAYTGKGPGDWLDYAVEFGGGAVGSVTNCTVTGCAGTALSDGSASAGFIATDYYGPGTAVTYGGNTVGSSTSAIGMGFLDTDATVVSASDNDFSGNDYGIANASTAVVIDGSANWWGSNDAATVGAYMDGDVDYTPWLDSGTDTSGDPGFQGDFSVLHVDAASPQTGSLGRIAEGIGLVSGSTVYVAPGTYAPFILNTSVNLLGAQAGVDARGRVSGSPNPVVESVITGATRLLELKAGCAGSVVDGFAFLGGTRCIESTSGPLTGLQILNNHFSGMSGTAFFLNDSGTDIDIDRNEFDGSGGTSTLCHLDQDNFAGLHFTNNNVLNRSAGTGLFCDGNHNIGVSATPRTPLIQGNVFDGNETGSNLGRFAFTGGDILDNDFLNSGYDGLQGGIQNTTVSGNTFDANGRYGLALTGFGGSTDPTRGAQNLDITGNTFTGNVSAGLLFSSSQYPGTISTNVANGNDFVGNTVGVSYAGSEAIAATCNWWGTIDGPNAPGNPSSGDPISGSTVQYAPWLDGSIAGSPSCDQYGGDYVAADPTGLCISGPTPCVTSAVEFVRGDTTPARGITVTVELSPELELCGAGIVQGDWLDGYGLGSTFQVLDQGGGVYVIDQAVLGGTTSCGPTVGGTLFTMDVTNTGADGTGTITVTAVDARDCGNPFALLPGIPGPPAEIQIDNTAPGAVADLAASQVKSGNDADGTTKIDLAWTAPPELDVVSVDLYRKGFGFYPEYDDDGGAAPSAPADPATALGAGWTHVVSLAGAASAYTDEPATRDYWYYVAYVTDDCGNVSAVSNRTDGTLNYHLGDVAVSPGDNQVGGVDVSALGAAYATSHGDALYDNELDVGPTADNSTDALPLTDNAIQFEDLIIMAINYGMVTKPMPGAAPADRNAVALRVVPEGDMIRAVVSLASDGAVRGLSVPLTWNGEAVEPMSFVEGELLGRQAGLPLLLSPAPGTVDAAVFGSAFAGEGELATVTFRVIGAGDPAIALGEVDARDGENRRVELGQTTDTGDLRTLPAVTRLLPCAPNPFRSASVISFALAEEGPVTLRIYAVDGRLVRTLVQNVMPAGERSVQWDGRDDGGRSVAAGAYLLRLQTTNTTESQRIVRLR